MNTTKKCPFCAEEIAAEAIKCKHCGSMLKQAQQAVAFDPNVVRKLADGYNFLAWFWLTISVIQILVGPVLIYKAREILHTSPLGGYMGSEQQSITYVEKELEPGKRGLGLWLCVASICNFLYARSRLALSKLVRERCSQALEKVPTVGGLAIESVFQLIFGFVIGLLCVVLDYILREKLLSIASAFKEVKSGSC